MRFIDPPLKSQRNRQFRSLRASFSFAAELLSARLWQLRLCNLELSALFATILGFIPVSLVNISLGYPLSFFKAREALEGERKEHQDIVVQERPYLREKGKRNITPWTLSYVSNGTFANIRKATALWRLRLKVVMSRSLFEFSSRPHMILPYLLLFCILFA